LRTMTDLTIVLLVSLKQSHCC